MIKFEYTTKTKKITGGTHTPVSVYLKTRDLYPKSALLESSDYHGDENSLSFIALKPIASIIINHGVAESTFPNGTTTLDNITEEFSVAESINQFLGRFDINGEDKKVCGLYGYTSFNAVKYLENIDIKESQDAINDTPDVYYILYKYVIVFNHLDNKSRIVEMLGKGEKSTISQIESTIKDRKISSYGFAAQKRVTSTTTDDQYKRNIRRGIDSCLRGDVFQIELSRRFVIPYKGDDFRLYRALRITNPSPYLFYFNFGNFHIFGSSPETHCRIDGRMIYIDPIAGTTRRTGNAKKDNALTNAILSDPQDNSEHVMLVDLARNDLSRNCNKVALVFYKEHQHYNHVTHLVSRVRGTLLEGANSVKTFIDTFPAGTLSGAPKIKAMQLISEIEPHDRAIYGGCIGFIGFDGGINQAISIRTFISRNNVLCFHAGVSVVALSTEEGELKKVNTKLVALKKAIILATTLKN